MKENLKDPESARFKLGPLLHSEGPYCGYVNAKNAMGGYVGFSKFMVRVRTFGKEFFASFEFLEGGDDSGGWGMMAKEECARAGYG